MYKARKIIHKATTWLRTGLDKWCTRPQPDYVQGQPNNTQGHHPPDYLSMMHTAHDKYRIQRSPLHWCTGQPKIMKTVSKRRRGNPPCRVLINRL
jgi:hypothetical protein